MTNWYLNGAIWSLMCFLCLQRSVTASSANIITAENFWQDTFRQLFCRFLMLYGKQFVVFLTQINLNLNFYFHERLYIVAYVSDIWVYPILKVISPLQRFFFLCGLLTCTAFIYKLGHCLNEFFWCSKSRSNSVDKKKNATEKFNL
jgi:hypothetical protein